MSAEPVPPYLQLHDDLEPALDAGITYEITVQHEVTGVDTKGYFASPQTRSVEVRAPQFSLEAAAVHAFFPPANVSGRFDRTLPHVTLESPILPWQRQLLAGDHQTPWLALLLFRPGELKPDPQTNSTTTAMTVAALLTQSESYVRPVLAEPPPAEVAAAGCQVLTIGAELLAAILPRAAELRLLVHARQAAVVDASGESGEGWYSTVVGNRFPDVSGGVHEAHLVSLEGLSQVLYPEVPAPPDAGTAKEVQMASLLSWRFTSLADHGERFSGLTQALAEPGATTSLRIPTPQTPASGEARAAARLEDGYVALESHLPTGERTFAWYRGPLTPGVAQPLPETAAPLISADQALIYVEADGLFDVSYAAAWSAGRALALADGVFGPALVALRTAARQLVHSQRREGGGARAPLATTLAEPDLAQRLTQQLGEQLQPLAAWLEDLRLLRGVPFANLVAAEQMLPAESLRFFHVDSGWLGALADGALALGVQSSFDAEVDRLLRGGLGAAVPAPPQAGLLLRSTLVSGWPGLVIEASAAGEPVPLLRSELLAPEIRICLFGAVPDAVALAEPAQGLHFGYEDTEAIELRRLQPPVGEELKQRFPASGDFSQFLRQGAEGVLDLDDGESGSLTAQLGAALGATIGPAALALQLIRGAERREFKVGR
jgi:hypothetical protein